MKPKTSFFPIMAGLLLGSLLTACSPNDSDAPQEPAASTASAPKAASAASEKPAYIVMTDATIPPFEFRDDNGEVIGWEVDIINAIAEDQGFTVKVLNRPWEGLLDTLNKGDSDIIISFVGVTDERKAKFDMSIPYLTGSKNAIVYKDPALNISGLSDLKNHSVATQEGTLYVDQVREVQKEGNGRIIPEKTLYIALTDLIKGKAQVAVGDASTLLYHIKAGNMKDQFKVLLFSTAENMSNSAIVVKKGNTELLEKINAGIKGIVANGTYQKINEKWFDDPNAMTPWQNK